MAAGRKHNRQIIGLLVAIVATLGGLSWCGRGDGADPAWERPGVVDKTGELLRSLGDAGLPGDGGISATEEGP